MSETPLADNRQADGRFTKGNPGGPGRPPNPVTRIAADLDRQGLEVAEELMAMAIEQARQGSLRAAEIVLQRVWPSRRSRPIELAPSPGDGLNNLLSEHAALAAAMMNGDITPQDAQAALRVFKALQYQMSRAASQKRAVAPYGAPK